MKTYHVQGMTCQGCAKSVTERLESLPMVKAVTVDVKAKEVSLDTILPDVLVKAAFAGSKFRLRRLNDNVK